MSWGNDKQWNHSTVTPPLHTLHSANESYNDVTIMLMRCLDDLFIRAVIGWQVSALGLSHLMGVTFSGCAGRFC